MPIITKTNALVRSIGTRFHRKNRILALIVTLSLAGASTLMATAPQHDPSVVPEKSWPVSTVLAQVEPLSPQLYLFGRVETPRHAQLSAAVQAQVMQLHVREGERVEAGQLLVSLDQADQTLLHQQAEADLRNAQAELEAVTRDTDTDQQVLKHMRDLHKLTRSKAARLKTLNSKNLIATEQLENTLQEVARQGIELARQQALVDKQPQRLTQAQAAVHIAQSGVQEQWLKLQRTRIEAPFSGRVSTIGIAPGDRVQIGQSLLTLYDTSALQVRVALPADAIERLKQTLDNGQIIPAHLAQSGLSASLAHLAGEVKSGTTGIDGLFTVDDPNGSLELGKAVDLRIDLPAESALVALPVQSIYSNQRIYLVEQGRLRSVEIEMRGRRINTAGELEILVSASAIEAGAQVLATALPKATTGLKVDVINNSVATLSAQGVAPAI